MGDLIKVLTAAVEDFQRRETVLRMLVGASETETTEVAVGRTVKLLSDVRQLLGAPDLEEVLALLRARLHDLESLEETNAGLSSAYDQKKRALEEREEQLQQIRETLGAKPGESALMSARRMVREWTVCSCGRGIGRGKCSVCDRDE